MKTNKNNKKTTVGAKKEAKETRKYNTDKRIDLFDESRTTNDPLALRKGEDGSQVLKRLKSNHDDQSDCNLPPPTSTWFHAIETQSPSIASGMEIIDLTGEADAPSSGHSKQDDQSDHNLPIPTSTRSHAIETQSPSIVSGTDMDKLSLMDDWDLFLLGGFSLLRNVWKRTDVATTTNVETIDLTGKTETIEDKVDPKCDDVKLDSFSNPRHSLDEDDDKQYTDLYEKLCNCDQNKTHK
jgi:hypothetical protein